MSFVVSDSGCVEVMVCCFVACYYRNVLRKLWPTEVIEMEHVISNIMALAMAHRISNPLSFVVMKKNVVSAVALIKELKRVVPQKTFSEWLLAPISSVTVDSPNFSPIQYCCVAKDYRFETSLLNVEVSVSLLVQMCGDTRSSLA